MSEYQICANCVMDTTDSKIRFDEKGICDHCSTFYNTILPNWQTDERGRRELEGMAQKIKVQGEGKDFDGILGMSGGIDSSYTTYIAEEKLGLRPSGWRAWRLDGMC